MRGSVIHMLAAVAAQIDRTGVRAANDCSRERLALTKRFARHARVEWPENTDAHWAAAADCSVRLTQYWLEAEPKRGVSAEGMSAVIVSMLRRTA